MQKQKSQVTVFYKGRVQGVGFRYTVISIASNFNVTGYVKNLRDGRVELCAEGDDSVLLGFLNAIDDSHLRRYITDKSTDWSTFLGKYNQFSVQYS